MIIALLAFKKRLISCMMEKSNHVKLVIIIILLIIFVFIELVKVWIVFICDAKLVMQLVYIALHKPGLHNHMMRNSVIIRN